MKNQEHIDNFSLTLTRLLNEELKLGNEIVETSTGWPDNNTILVLLKKPFRTTYSVDNIEYRNINDPHYWKAEYFDNLTRHILACKF